MSELVKKRGEIIDQFIEEKNNIITKSEKFFDALKKIQRERATEQKSKEEPD